MAYAIIRDGAPVELTISTPFVGAGGVQHPGDWSWAWDDALKAERGLMVIVEPAPVAEGFVRLSTSLEIVGDAVVRVANDAPAE